MKFTFGRCIVLITAFAAGILAQSADQAFPTAVRSNEIIGTIKARDIGDARLTTYFYAFNGDQGDVFVNVVTKNFDGDIDVFTVDGLRPLTKIVIYSDAGQNETGRIIYLRKSERLLLRIQGRTPNDDAALYKIKFAGSFVALTDSGEDDVKAPVVASAGAGDVTVNSVGTIIERPVVKKPEVKIETSATKEPVKVEEVDPVGAKDTTKRPVKKAASTPVKTTTAKAAKSDVNSETKPPPVRKTPSAKKPKPVAAKKEIPTPEAEPDPMAAFTLVILFKDGKRIERPMTEILRFSVDRGVLTVITKEGFIGRYSMMNIARVSME